MFVFAGVSYFWVPAGLNTAFGVWFGIYGALGQAIANITVCLLFGFPITIATGKAIAEAVEILIPAVVFMVFKIDPELKTKRDWIMYFLFGCLINTAVASFIGTSSMHYLA
ncbi:MAG: hypothetical protein ACTSYO_06480 [Candidatus Ranarchaeia archaeon]